MTRRRTVAALTAAVLALSLSACGGASTDPADLEDRTWVLTEFGEQDANPAVVSTVVLRDGRLGGNGGVNDLLGSYDADEDGNLTFEKVGTTKKAGPQEAMDQETRLLETLEKVATFEVEKGDDDDPDELEMRNASGTTVLQFSEQP